jgi:hypothetical protein
MDVLRFTMGDGAGLFSCGMAVASGFLGCIFALTLGKKIWASAFGVVALIFLALAIVTLVTTNRVAGGG